MDISELSVVVDGDSITAGSQWTKYAADILCAPQFYNIAVGSSTWHLRKYDIGGTVISSQLSDAPGFAGISDGWMPTDDIAELQRRANNCAVVHISRFLKKHEAKEVQRPDVFIFSMGTNDLIDSLGSADKALEGKEPANCDLFTTAGAVRWCLQSVSEAFPGCRCIVILPIQTGSPAHNEENRLKSETITKVSKAMGAQVIDPINCGICEKFEHENTPGRYLLDGLHPNDAGRELMGRFIASKLKTMIY